MNRAIEIQRMKLLARLRRRFDVLIQPTTIAGRSIELARVRNPDHLLNVMANEEGRRADAALPPLELRLPYWAQVWDSAVAVSTFLLESLPATVRQTTLLDLGCGVGLSSAAAALAGYRVTAVDLESPALLFARWNTLAIDPTMMTRQVDWRRDDLTCRFERIVAADVLYEREQWPFLDAFWKRHLAPHGTVILGEPGRPTAEDFAAWAQDHGWRVSASQHQVVATKRPVRLYQLLQAK